MSIAMHADPTFTILALGTFAPLGAGGSCPRPVPVATSSLEDAMSALAPRLWIPLSSAICPDAGLTLIPERMEDLLPEGLIRKTPYLKDLHSAGAWIESAAAGGIEATAIAERVRQNWPALSLDLSLPDEERGASSRSAVDDLLAMVSLPEEGKNAHSGAGGPSSWRRQIDGLLTATLTAIFSNHEFRAFEAAWRGAEIVIGQEAGSRTRLYLVPVAASGLAEALDVLSRQVSEIQPNLIVIDIPFDNSPWSIETLNRVARFAENLLAPAAVWITPAFLHLHGWDELHRLPLLRNHITDAAYAKWRKLMASPEGRWLAAIGNRFLARPPYGIGTPVVEANSFEEREPLWIAPVWAMAALAAQSMTTCGWPTRLAGDLALRLPGMTGCDLPGGRGRGVTEGEISGERIDQLGEIGVTMLAGVPEGGGLRIPWATTAAGEPLGFQLFFSCLITFLIRCRESTPAGAEDLPPERFVHEALAALFQRTGLEPPDDLTVRGSGAEGDEPFSLAISFTPPRAIGAGNRQIAFTFSW